MRTLLITATLAIAPTLASAQIFGGTNFGFGGYPEIRCSKPYKPSLLRPSTRTEQEYYNLQARAYAAEWDQYIDCVKTYVENAQNDIKRVQRRAADAIDEAKNP